MKIHENVIIKKILTLDNNDPLVINARNAEKALFDYYSINAKEHYVILPEQQIKVRVLEIGKGEPLVIVPGNTGDTFPLVSLMAQLKGKRIFAINRPGGGLSEGMDHGTVDIQEFAHFSLNTVLDALNLKNVHIVAHSMGAHWSILLAIHHPEKVKKLSLLGNPGNIMGGKPPLAIRILVKIIFSKQAMKLLIPKNKGDALRSLKMMGHSKELVATLPKQLEDTYFCFQHLPHYLVSSISLIQNMIPKITEEDLRKLKQPTVLILGTNDNFISQKLGKKITAAMPNGKFYMIENSGHLPWLENAEKIAKIILG